ncbi:MAG: ATP12 family protein [Novosphingobium sp.]
MKRFYQTVSAEAAADGWRVLLDGRPIKTVGGQPQVVPTRKLAKALAAEWEAQGPEIALELFILRDQADYAIDVVAPNRTAAIRSLLAYAETDTLCYRAEHGEALHDRQLIVWEPLLTAAEDRWDVRFERIGGIIHQVQPPETLARLEAELAALDDFALTALRNTASLSASLVIGLAALEPDADPHALWNAANLEEDWQAELWGKDWEAMELRDKRFAAFAAAMRFAELSRAEP